MDWIESYEKLSDLFLPAIEVTARYTKHCTDSDRFKLIYFKISDFYMWNFEGTLLLADNPMCSNLNTIFPPHPESIFLSQMIPSAYGNKIFMDVGIGTGILSIIAAKKGWQCIGSDINERAIRIAKLNAKINNVNVSLYADSLASSYKKSEVQLCIANLPFESTPEGQLNYLHSDGGKYGDKLIFPFLDNLDNILVKSGVLLIPAFSLCKKNESRIEINIKLHKFNDFDRAIVRLSDQIDIRALYTRYAGTTWKSTYEQLKSEGYSHFAIDLCIMKKVDKNQGQYQGTYFANCAGKEWVMPVGIIGIGKPLQDI